MKQNRNTREEAENRAGRSLLRVTVMKSLIFPAPRLLAASVWDLGMFSQAEDMSLIIIGKL